ncbi:xanthine dehydrogenase accessory factor [Alkalispirillum mobile]|uniref:Xanthine dehydrogenase accessory factor n=1 Tax=Alkalispirillum mobile TaxID=85925 RepID=A0A498CDG8_9GAMM|nr:XdhC family protein [Alkalispirillum mobile]RLK50498.1 xanthine dehydrogenase accessory factor [Alkalispirillum mobile]
MSERDVLDVLVELRDRGAPHALATVIEVEGSVSAQTGSKAVFDGEGRLLAGWVGGGCADATTAQAARQSLETGEGQVILVDMDDEILGTGVPCGGRMRLWVEPALPRPTLWLLGAGRLSETLCRIATATGFQVVVNDPRATRERFPDARTIQTDDMDYRGLRLRPGDFVVVATQHKGDHHAIASALAGGAEYIALVASRKRAALVLEGLREDGHDEARLAAVVAPAGLDLGGREPEEIALAILAEIVTLRRGGSGRRLRDVKPLPTPGARN